MTENVHPIDVTRSSEATLEDAGDGTRSAILGSAGDRELGIWEIDPGVSTDVEVDEVFIVLGGSATISVDGFPDVRVQTGDIVNLVAGTATTWTVHERLRKVYLVSNQGEP